MSSEQREKPRSKGRSCLGDAVLGVVILAGVLAVANWWVENHGVAGLPNASLGRDQWTGHYYPEGIDYGRPAKRCPGVHDSFSACSSACEKAIQEDCSARAGSGSPCEPSVEWECGSNCEPSEYGIVTCEENSSHLFTWSSL